jgi:hypothetical protein
MTEHLNIRATLLLADGEEIEVNYAALLFAINFIIEYCDEGFETYMPDLITLRKAMEDHTFARALANEKRKRQ